MSIKDVAYEGTRLSIKEFKLNYLKPNAAIAMIAKRGSGKSWVCRDIIKQNKDIPGGMIIAPTDKMSAFYSREVLPVVAISGHIRNSYLHDQKQTLFIHRSVVSHIISD